MTTVTWNPPGPGPWQHDSAHGLVSRSRVRVDGAAGVVTVR